jgi:hypothetical protein
MLCNNVCNFIQEVNQRLAQLQSERQTLDLRVQTTVQANPMCKLPYVTMFPFKVYCSNHLVNKFESLYSLGLLCRQIIIVASI